MFPLVLLSLSNRSISAPLSLFISSTPRLLGLGFSLLALLCGLPGKTGSPISILEPLMPLLFPEPVVPPGKQAQERSPAQFR